MLTNGEITIGESTHATLDLRVELVRGDPDTVVACRGEVTFDGDPALWCSTCVASSTTRRSTGR